MVEKKTLGKGTEKIIRKTIKEFKKEYGSGKEIQELVEARIKAIEWKNSLDGIWEQINTLMTDTVLEDDKTKLVIAKTLLKLPYKVREKVLNDNVAFVLSSYRGLVLELHFPILVRKSELKKIGEGDYIYEHKQPVIFLAFSPKTKEAEIMTTVAHEVAHFILGHHKTHHVKGGKGYLNERKADDLCEKWGFERAYKSYDPLIAQ